MPVKAYFKNKITQKKVRINGMLPSTRKPNKPQLRQHFASKVRYSAQQLPPKVDLRPGMTTVEDQADIGSCVANAFAGAYEFLLKQTTGYPIDVSRLFIYYNARVRDLKKGKKLTDSGCYVSSAIESLEEYGTCLETIWPYNDSQVNKRPNQQAFEAARNNRITEAFELDIDLTQMKSCLAQGFPFAFGLTLYDSFDRAAKTGVVPMPKVNEVGRDTHSNHSMLAVGYSDLSNAFIIRNSWGVDWGDQGYCYIPYDYMTDADKSHDLWTVRQLGSYDMGRDYWHQNDSINYYYPPNRGYNGNYDDEYQYGIGNDVEYIVENDDEDDDNGDGDDNEDGEENENEDEDADGDGASDDDDGDDDDEDADEDGGDDDDVEEADKDGEDEGEGGEVGVDEVGGDDEDEDGNDDEAADDEVGGDDEDEGGNDDDADDDEGAGNDDEGGDDEGEDDEGGGNDDEGEDDEGGGDDDEGGDDEGGGDDED